jgi:hypothetical protein
MEELKMKILQAFVYRNLHQAGVCYSVKDRSTGKVAMHSNNLVVSRANFIVQKGGQAKVRQLGRKQVHAGVVGDLVVDPIELAKVLPELQSAPKAHYNPYQNDTFVSETNEPLTKADYVLLTSENGKSSVRYINKEA